LRTSNRPIEVNVHLTSSDEVLALRERVNSLEKELSVVKDAANRTEFLYRCEVLINERLVDLCKDNEIRIPKSLYHRPTA